MNQESRNSRYSERGGAGAKLLVALVIIVIIGRAGWNAVPVFYQAQDAKQELATAVKKAVTLPDKNDPKDTLMRGLDVLKRAAVVPNDAKITISEPKNVLQANIRYSQKISLLPFGLYDYDFIFNHTATVNGIVGE